MLQGGFMVLHPDWIIRQWPKGRFQVIHCLEYSDNLVIPCADNDPDGNLPLNREEKVL